MNCKYCDSEKVVKNGTKGDRQRYLCKDCGHKFFEGSEFPRMRTEARIISSSIDFYFEGLSTRKIQTQIEKLYGVHVDHSTVLRWILKYSNLVSRYVETLTPQLLGIYHVDETAIKCKGVQKWFWEIIDDQTKFLVAGHLSGLRTIEEAVALFEKSMKVAKKKPTSIYCDGLKPYVDAYNQVFRTMKKETRPELVRRVGIKAIHNQNVVERLHSTLKDRIKPTRGLKGEKTVRTLLEGWVVHYNYVRKHQTLKMTPAQASGLNVKNDWYTLVKDATKNEAKREEKQVQQIEMTVK
ncbi:MAG: IS6 family transposase [Candidatus Bathyarchaeia archaeon]